MEGGIRMYKNIKEEKGVTLVELLAVIVVIAIVSSLITGVLIQVQKQYRANTEAIGNLTDLTTAAKGITRDIRTADDVTVENNILTILHDDQEIVYSHHDDVLKRNESSYLYRIKDFQVEKNVENDNQTVTLFFLPEQGEKLETEITLRKGYSNEMD